MQDSTSTTIDELAGLVSQALGSADLEAYRELLDPNVRWGPPGDEVSGCHNRDEVLAWYRRGYASGVRAVVTETVVEGDRILVGLGISGGQEGDAPERWQVLTVAGGRVTDIRGFDEREDALSHMR